MDAVIRRHFVTRFLWLWLFVFAFFLFVALDTSPFSLCIRHLESFKRIKCRRSYFAFRRIFSLVYLWLLCFAYLRRDFSSIWMEETSKNNKRGQHCLAIHSFVAAWRFFFTRGDIYQCGTRRCHFELGDLC